MVGVVQSRRPTAAPFDVEERLKELGFIDANGTAVNWCRYVHCVFVCCWLLAGLFVRFDYVFDYLCLRGLCMICMCVRCLCVGCIFADIVVRARLRIGTRGRGE